MDADMVTMFPNGIRALMIDDDTKFLKSATTLLSVLNFNVVRCSSVAHALRSLTSGGHTGFDVILVHAVNATTCGFDFRAIVETDLLIPVIYLLEKDYEATGDEARELLRTLQAPGSYIIKKPLDMDEVRTRLWTVIAFRKCDLQTKASRGGAAGGEGVGGDDKGRVHFKAVMKGRGRKRKGGSRSRNPGGSSAGTTVAAGGGHRTAKGKEKENVGSQLQTAQQNDSQAKKAQKNGGGEVYNLPQPNTTMTNGHQPNPCNMFMQSFLRMLTVSPNNPEFFMKSIVPMPSYSPMFFSGAVGPSTNAAAFSNTINTTGGTPATPPHPLYSTGLPAQHPVARQQQHPSAHNNIIFGNIVSPLAAAAPTMATTAIAATAAYEPPQFSQGISNKQQQDDAHPQLMFGPLPYQGLTLPKSLPVVQQDILAPAAAADHFTGGVARGAMTGGALAAAAAATETIAYADNDVNLTFLQAPNLHAEQDGTKEFAAVATEAGAYGNDVSLSFLQPLSMITEQDGDGELAGLMGKGLSYASVVDPHAPMLPQHTNDDDASTGKAKVLDLLFNDDYNAGSSAVTPDNTDQILGMALSLNELTTLAAGAFGSSNSNSVVSLMASQGQGTGNKEAMLSFDHYEDGNTTFPLEALLGDMHGDMFELDNDDDLEALPTGGSTGGGAATADDGAGTSLIAGEEDGNVNGLANLAGIDIPHDVWHMNDLPSPQSQSRNKNNVHE